MSTIEKGFGDAFKANDHSAGRDASSDPAGDVDTSPAIELKPINNVAAAPASRPPRHAGAAAQPWHVDGYADAERHSTHLVRREPPPQPTSPLAYAVNEAYPPGGDAEFGDDFDLAGYLRVIRRHRWGIVSIVLLVLTATIIAAFSITPTYRAKTTLIAEPFQRKVTVQEEFINSAAVYLFYDTQFEIIRSRALAERVVDKLDLVAQAKQAAAQQAAGAEDDIGTLAAIGAAFSSWFDWRRWSGDDDDAVETVAPSDDMLRKRLAIGVQGQTSVEGGKQSQIIHIYYEHENAGEAARRANALAKAYVAYGTDTRNASSQRTNEWLTDQIAEVKTKLDGAEAALLDYKEANQMVDTGKQQALADARLRDLTAKLVAAKSLRAEAELRYEQVKELSVTDAKRIEALDGIRDDQNVTKIAFEVRSFERELGELRARVTDSHPDLKLMRAKVAETRAALRREVSKIADSRRNAFEIADTRVREIEELMAAEKDLIGATTSSALELVRLERDVENNRKLYEALLVRLQETDVTSDLDTTNVQILDYASRPGAPFKPNKVRMITIALVLGLMLGVVVVFIREHLDRSLKSPDDVRDKLGLTTLGIVPLVTDAYANPDTQFLDDPRSAFAEKINHIRTGLLFSSIDHPPQTMLLTSATGGEGKTAAAINLAASFSQLGKTLLLEVDLRKPTLRERLETGQALGLTDLMLDTTLANKVIRPLGDNPQLHVLTCGTRPGNPLELLSSQQFRHLLAQLREHFRYIVLDGPPILAVSDAAVLGNIVDSTLVVAKAESTPLKMVSDAVELLRKAHVVPEGVVLSQADAKRMAYYGGDDQYNERYYGQQEAADRAMS